MNTRPLILTLFLMTVPAIAAVTNSQGTLIRDDFKVKDEASACMSAEEYSAKAAPAWMKSAFHAKCLSLSRSPVDFKDKLKRGDVIWIVSVENAAESHIDLAPVNILWIKAKDGKLFESVPKDKKE